MTANTQPDTSDDAPTTPVPSVQDGWNLDLWLSRCIVTAVKAQAEYECTPAPFEQDEWQQTLEKITLGFQAYIDNDGRPFFERTPEHAGFVEAFDLFKKNFGGLWT